MEVAPHKTVNRPAPVSTPAGQRSVTAPREGTGASASIQSPYITRFSETGILNRKSVLTNYLKAKGQYSLQKGFEKLHKPNLNGQTHDTAFKKLVQSEIAVNIPPSEGQSKSNAGQINEVSNRTAPAVDESRARQRLSDSLSANIPQSIEEVDNFKRDKKAQTISTEVHEQVSTDKEGVISTFDEMGQTPPAAAPEHQAELLPPEEQAPATPEMKHGKGVIAPLQNEHTDLSGFTKEADSKLKEEGITQEQLDEFSLQASSPDASEEEKNGKSLIASTKNKAIKEPFDPNLVLHNKELFDIYAEGSGGKKMSVTRKTGSLGGDTVGLEMSADWLGANSLQGSPPQSGVHANLMGLLITDLNESSQDKYIRGHLLNEHMGGLSVADNMFPITGNANSQHLHSTEKRVKNWMKKPKRWVKYEVKVVGISSRLDGGPKSWNNYVNSTFACKAVLKDAAGKAEEEFSTSITSTFKKKTRRQQIRQVEFFRSLTLIHIYDPQFWEDLQPPQRASAQLLMAINDGWS